LQGLLLPNLIVVLSFNKGLHLRFGQSKKRRKEMKDYVIEKSDGHVIVILEGHSQVSKTFNAERQTLGGKLKLRGNGPDGYGLYWLCQDNDMSNIDAMACVFDASQEEAVRALCDRTYGRLNVAIQEVFEMQDRLEALEEEIRNLRPSGY